jgi:hypothetical protein
MCFTVTASGRLTTSRRSRASWPSGGTPPIHIPLRLGGGDFVPDPLARYFPLELPERKQDIQREAAHRSGRVELLRDCNKRNAASVEHLDHLSEVGKRACEVIDFVNDHHVDECPPDIFQEVLKGGTFHGPLRKAAIIVGGPDEPPALARLALDEGLTRLALRVQGVEVLLQPFFGRLPRVDRAASCSRPSVFHRGVPFVIA